jgi:hypothetical protein
MVFLMFFAVWFTTAGAVAAESGERIVKVVLQGSGNIGGEWKYSARGDGSVTESTMSEYYERDNFAEPAPGTVEFYFKGARPGRVNINFIHTDASSGSVFPDASAQFKAVVFSDLTLFVFSVSENYE